MIASCARQHHWTQQLSLSVRCSAGANQ